MRKHQKNKIFMKIALVQMHVEQSRFDENLKRACEAVKKAKSRGAEFAILPEMFASGFNYGENKKAIASGRNFVRDFLEIAKENKIFLAGTVPHLEENSPKPSNRMIFASPDGEILASYDKIHLFGVFHEDRHISCGNSIVVKKMPFANIGFAVCYDLRFPEMFVNIAQKKADLIVVSTAWPHPRMGQLRTLMRARAIECQCFLACVNQIGVENFGSNKIEYCGSSAIIDPFGDALCECKKDAEDLQIADIDFEKPKIAREKIPVLSDRRPDIYFK